MILRQRGIVSIYQDFSFDSIGGSFLGVKAINSE